MHIVSVSGSAPGDQSCSLRGGNLAWCEQSPKERVDLPLQYNHCSPAWSSVLSGPTQVESSLPESSLEEDKDENAPG